MPRREPYFEDKSLVGYWKFDEGGGSIAYDSSRYQNNGTIIGATYSSAWQGLRFDGVDDYVNAGNNASLNITNAITIAAWIKPRTIVNDAGIVSRTATIVALLGFSGTNGMRFRVQTTGGEQQATVTETPTLNQYSLVVGTYNNGTILLYINGISKATTSLTGTIISNNENLRIGNDRNDAGDGVRYFDGTIDEVRIWNRALSVDEIKEYYQKGKWRI